MLGNMIMTGVVLVQSDVYEIQAWMNATTMSLSLTNTVMGGTSTIYSNNE
jgi:hypothetical protein